MTSHDVLTKKTQTVITFRISYKLTSPKNFLLNRPSSINVADTLPDCHNSKSHLKRSDVKAREFYSRSIQGIYRRAVNFLFVSDR